VAVRHCCWNCHEYWVIPPEGWNGKTALVCSEECAEEYRNRAWAKKVYAALDGDGRSDFSEK